MDILNNILNESEGWNIFTTIGSDDGECQIQRIDDAEKFENDGQAIGFVIAKVVVDHSQRHKTALQYIRTYNKKEWKKVEKIAKELKVEGSLDLYIY